MECNVNPHGDIFMRRLCIALLLILAFALAGCEKGGNRISKIEPNFGNISGRDDVVITGNGFKPGMTVFFGSHQATSLVIDTAKQIRVKTPSGAEGKVDVILTTEDGRTFGLPSGFEYRREN